MFYTIFLFFGIIYKIERKINMNVNRDLKKRIKRLEALVGILIATGNLEGGDLPFSSDLEYFVTKLFRGFDEDMDLYHFLRHTLHEKERYKYKNVEYFDSKISTIMEDISELERKTNNFEIRIRETHNVEKKQITNENDINYLKKNIDLIKKDIYPYLSALSNGIDFSEIKIIRYYPLRIYSSEHKNMEAISKLMDAIESFYKIFGFEIADEYAPEFHSWFKKWFLKSKDLLSKEEVKERLEKAERALELMHIQKHQASIDKDLAEAASNVLKATENIPNVACQIGSILLVKITNNNIPKVMMRSLSPKEMIHLEKNQGLLNNPHNILEELSRLCSSKKEIENEDFNS